MKKSISCLLILTMMLAILSACGAEKAAEESTKANVTEAAAEATVTDAVEEPQNLVHTVDEFLAALGSDTEITLAPGTYDFTQASDYGQTPSSSAYNWGEEIQTPIITGLNNLTIHGTDAQLIPGNSEGYPLIFENCSNLTLDGLTVSHSDAVTDGQTTLALKGCKDTKLQNMTLQGTAALLLSMAECQNVTVQDCAFTGPAPQAVGISGSQNITVDNCRIYDLGKGQKKDNNLSGMLNILSLFSAGSSENITLSGCQFENNQTGLISRMESCRKVYIRNNTFTGNAVEAAAFCFWSSAPHLEGNTFENNEPWTWYYPNSEYAVDENGADLTSDLLSPQKALKEPGAQKEIHVSTAEEFLNAIGPDTKIILDCEVLDLSTAPDYGKSKNEYYFWEQEYDGPQLVITEVDNLTITSQDSDCKAHTISAVPRYADVLSFRFCTNLVLSNFTAGHTVEPGFCSGGVLDFKECRSTDVENCGLYGCGILGITAYGGNDLSILNCDIYECSNGGVSIKDVNGLTIDNTTFRDLGGPDLYVRNCKNATQDGKPIEQD